MEQSNFKRKVRFILRFGRALHSMGTPAHALEATLVELSGRLGIEGTFMSLPTSIIYSFSFEDEELTKIERVGPMGINLGKLSELDLIAREVISGELSYEEGQLRLNEILHSPDPFSKKVQMTYFIFSTIAFLVLFGGNFTDLAASVVVACLIGLMSLSRPDGGIGQFFEIIVAIIASLATYLLNKLIPGLNVGIIILSSLIVYMPGLFMTIAIAEIATDHLVSGTSRLVGGVMILLKLTFGVFIGSKIASWFHFSGIEVHSHDIPSWAVFVTLPLTAFISVINFKAARSDWKWVTLAGIYGYLCSKLGTTYLGLELGVFFGGLCVGAMSNLFARIFDKPSSLIQWPGILLLVPGSIGFRGMGSLFERDVIGGLDMAFTMITIALALVVGVFSGNLLVRPRKSF